MNTRVCAAFVALLSIAAAMSGCARQPWLVTPTSVLTGKDATIFVSGPHDEIVEQIYLEPGGWPQPIVLPHDVNHAARLVLALTPEQRLRGLLRVDARATQHFQEAALAQCTLSDSAATSELLIVGCGKHGIQIFEFVADAAPRWRSSHSKLGNVRWVRAVDDQTLIVIDDARYAMVIDVSNAAQPLVDYAFPLALTPDSVTTSNNRLLIEDRHSTVAYQLDDMPPRYSNENLNGGEGVNFGGQRRGFIVDNTLYVADWFSGIHIYDISQPERPRLLSSYHTPGSPKGIVVRNGIAYVADDDHGLHVVDVKDPRAPTHITTIATTGLAYTPVIDGARLYLASHRGGFQIFDLTNPRAPQLLSDIDTPGKAWSLAVTENRLLVADSEAGVLSFDVSDPAAPKVQSAFAPGGNAEDILVKDDRAYVAFFDDGVYVLDIRDPTRLDVISHIPTPGNARGLVIEHNTLWIADWLAGVHRYDITDNSAPRWLASFDTPGAAWGLNVKDDNAYVFDWWGGLRVLNVDSSGSLAAHASYNQDVGYAAVAIAGRYLFAAQFDHGLQVFDIKNPLNPTWITGVELPGVASDIAIDASTAYVALGDAGVAEFDIRNPFQPQLLNIVPTTRRAQTVAVKGNVIAVGTSQGEIDVYARERERADAAPLISLRSVRDFVLGDDTLYFINGEGRLGSADLTASTKPAALHNHNNLTRIRLNHHTLIAVQNDATLLLLDRQRPDHVQSQLNIDGVIRDVVLEANGGYIATADGILAFGVNAQSALFMSGSYPLHQPPARLFGAGPVLFGASDRDLLAVKPLAPPRKQPSVQGAFRIPAGLPEGTYSLRLVTPTGDVATLQDALHIRGLLLRGEHGAGRAR